MNKQLFPIFPAMNALNEMTVEILLYLLQKYLVNTVVVYDLQNTRSPCDASVSSTTLWSVTCAV